MFSRYRGLGFEGAPASAEFESSNTQIGVYTDNGRQIMAMPMVKEKVLALK